MTMKLIVMKCTYNNGYTLKHQIQNAKSIELNKYEDFDRTNTIQCPEEDDKNKLYILHRIKEIWNAQI